MKKILIENENFFLFVWNLFFLWMILKYLLTIIENYNEDGIFIKYQQGIYWFNGKRMEFWCHRKGNSRIFTWDGDLYYGGMIFKNKQFIKYDYSINHPLHIFAANQENTVLINKKYSRLLTTGNFCFSKVPKKMPENGYKSILIGNEIFVFSLYHNEKFNIQTEKWTDFANLEQGCQNERFYKEIYMHANTLYGIINDSLIYMYDAIIDEWKSISFFFL